MNPGILEYTLGNHRIGHDDPREFIDGVWMVNGVSVFSETGNPAADQVKKTEKKPKKTNK